MELNGIVPEAHYAEFESLIGAAIPTGFHIHETEVIDREDFFAFLNKEYTQVMTDFPEMIYPVDTIDETFIQKFLLRIGMDTNIFYRSLPSLGGGNHFLEYGETNDGRGFFTAHCGSRNLGVKVCSYWLRKANENNCEVSFEENRKIIEDVKASCKDKTQWGRLIA